MKQKINKILTVICASSFAWLGFIEYDFPSFLFFGEIPRPEAEED